MTLQWTAVALFLYLEIAVLVILCLPFISARRWQTVFRFTIWNKLAQFWNKAFLTMIIILIVLFLDAIREVRKYSGADPSKDAKLHPNMSDHLHMKLFRAQRNLYISGFSIFLCLVMRRVITLITQLATATGTREALQSQAENANRMAKRYMENNEEIKKALDERQTVEERQVDELTEQLKAAQEALRKSQTKLDTMKEQTEGLTQEYDRLLQEHQKLQVLQKKVFVKELIDEEEKKER